MGRYPSGNTSLPRRISAWRVACRATARARPAWIATIATSNPRNERNRVHTLKLLATMSVLFLFATAGPARAQTTLGSVVATVTDPSGAGVANARLTLTDLGTNQTQTVSSSANGNYEFS